MLNFRTVGDLACRTLPVVVCSAVIVFAPAEPAWAYIDPTAAGSALQSLYVLLMGLVAALALIPQKLTALIRKFSGLRRSSRVELPQAAVDTEEASGDRS